MAALPTIKTTNNNLIKDEREFAETYALKHPFNIGCGLKEYIYYLTVDEFTDLSSKWESSIPSKKSLICAIATQKAFQNKKKYKLSPKTSKKYMPSYRTDVAPFVMENTLTELLKEKEMMESKHKIDEYKSYWFPTEEQQLIMKEYNELINLINKLKSKLYEITKSDKYKEESVSYFTMFGLFGGAENRLIYEKYYNKYY